MTMGLGFLPEAFVGCLAAKSAVREVVVVVVLPLLRLLGEDLGVPIGCFWPDAGRRSTQRSRPSTTSPSRLRHEPHRAPGFKFQEPLLEVCAGDNFRCCW